VVQQVRTDPRDAMLQLGGPLMRSLLRLLLASAAVALTSPPGQRPAWLNLPYAEPDLVLLAVLALAVVWGPNLARSPASWRGSP